MVHHHVPPRNALPIHNCYEFGWLVITTMHEPIMQYHYSGQDMHWAWMTIYRNPIVVECLDLYNGFQDDVAMWMNDVPLSQDFYKYNVSLVVSKRKLGIQEPWFGMLIGHSGTFAMINSSIPISPIILGQSYLIIWFTVASICLRCHSQYDCIHCWKKDENMCVSQ